MEHNKNISNQVIIHDVLNTLKTSGYDGFTARPWNYYKPETTLWWLVPSTEWPSYKYGKLVLFRSEVGYRIGFHIEKGISEKAGQMLSPSGARKLCIKSDWAWNSLVLDLIDGKFNVNMKIISEAVSKPLRITFQASSFTSEYDPYSEKIEGLETDHTMVFKYMDGNFQMLQDELKGEMRKYRNINNPTDLVDVFKGSELDWFWIDMFVTAEVESTSESHINEIALTFVRYYNDMFGF